MNDSFILVFFPGRRETLDNFRVLDQERAVDDVPGENVTISWSDYRLVILGVRPKLDSPLDDVTDLRCIVLVQLDDRPFFHVKMAQLGFIIVTHGFPGYTRYLLDWIDVLECFYLHGQSLMKWFHVDSRMPVLRTFGMVKEK